MKCDWNGRVCCALLAALMSVSLTFPAAAEENPFEDVEDGKYYYEAVLWAVGKEIVKGYTDTIFAPYASCSRGAAVMMLWRAAGSPQPGTPAMIFEDIRPDAVYQEAVAWASSKDVEITQGLNPGQFKPGEAVTREQFVTFLYRYNMYRKKNAQTSASTSGRASFEDVDRESPHYDAITWAAGVGVTTGVTPTEFYPVATCTRGQIVTFFFRYFSQI